MLRLVCISDGEAMTSSFKIKSVSWLRAES